MKTTKVLSTIGVAALGLAMSATASFAGYMQPGETMGLSLISPLPEGVFAADLESYGRSKPTGSPTNLDVGVNIPVLIWSTPISFYNTRLEILAGFPFAHIDGSGADRIGFASFALGPLLAHDFGNGLTGGVGALLRTPDASQNIQDLTGQTDTAIDLRESLQYKIPGNGPFGGITLMQNAAFTTTLRKQSALTVTSDGLTVRTQNDFFAGDFTAEKSFGKFTIGFVGYGNIDTNNVNQLGTAANPSVNPREKNIALGGLVGYDFGRFSLTGIVTHSLFKTAIVPAISLHEETRGWVRVVVPLYIAPPPSAPVVARY
jgi:Putative MetA-pathway of phenol degradation